MIPGSGFRGRFVAVCAIIAASVLSPIIASASDLVFGPVTCQRGTGAPTVFEYSFSVAGPSRGYIFKVYNGGLEDTTYELVSSSTITLNGIEILGPSSFSRKFTSLEVPVALQAQNTLNIEVRGKPGGAMIIKVYPFVVINAPTERQVFGADPVIVSGHLYFAATSISVNGLPGTVSADTFTVTGVPLAQGSNTLTATATREGGFTGSDSVLVTLDSIPPTVSIQHPLEGLATRQDVLPLYTATDTLDPNPTVSVSPRPPYVAEGAYQMTVTATDWAGNSATATRGFVIDKTAPLISGLSPTPESAIADSQTAVSASFSDALSGIDVASTRLLIDSTDVSAGAALSEQSVSYHPAMPLADGPHQIVLMVHDRAGNVATASWSFVVDTTPPRITVLSPAEGVSVATATVDLSAAVDDPTASVTVNGTSVALTGTDFSVSGLALTLGQNTILIEAHDFLGNNSTVALHVTYVPPSGNVSISASPSTIHLGETVTLTWTATAVTGVLINQGIGRVQPVGTIVVKPTSTTEYVLTAAGTEGASQASILVTVLGSVQPQPEGSFGARYQDQIPQDATVAAYDAKRFSLVTGTVHDRNDQPVAGVSVSILSHPEYGTVLTDDEGKFTLPVEGGGVLTVSYKKSGYLTTHRQVDMPWNDIAIVQTITMIPEDIAVTKVTFNGNAATVTVHQSTVVTDEYGSRSTTMVFTGDNTAYAKVGDKEIQLSSIDVRATEFDTPNSMPAKLPPNSAYTYCVDLAVDGAEQVRFAKPVVIYIDNFLGFPVGMAVPLGYYDYLKAAWVPSDNGVVVSLLDTNVDGIVDGIDSTGDGLPDDLNGNGQTLDDALGLGDSVKYVAGSTYWRATITHVTPWDCNWPYGPPAGATAPNITGTPTVDQPKTMEDEHHNSCTNSYVDDLGRIYHEDVPVPGTPIRLHYSSRSQNTAVDIPVAGVSVPASLKRIEVELGIAGRKYTKTLAPTSLEPVRFVWDGKDYLGRLVNGTTTGDIKIGYVYDAMYYSPGSFGASFGQAGGQITAIRSRSEIVSWQSSQVSILGNQVGSIAQGWSIPGHRQLDLSDTTTQFDGGDISKRYGKTISTIGGNGTKDYNLYSTADGASALVKGIVPVGIATDTAGNVYFTNQSSWSQGVYKIDRMGILHKILDRGWVCNILHDPEPAANSCMWAPQGITVDDQGNIYVADSLNRRIRKIDTKGIISTIAGNGLNSFSALEGPATTMAIGTPQGVAVDSVGNVYFSADREYLVDGLYEYEGRVYKVDPRGVLSLVAGGAAKPDLDGVPANSAALRTPKGIAVDRAGNLFIADSGYGRVRKVDRTGIISTIAGIRAWEVDKGDGSPATKAKLWAPRDVAIDSVGNLYIADSRNYRVRKVDSKGIISTVVGNGQPGFMGDGGAPIDARMNYPVALAFDGKDDLYIADSGYITDGRNYRIRRVSNLVAADNNIISSDEGVGYRYTLTGLHVSTTDLYSEIPLVHYTYDSEDRLIAISDQFNNTTSIQRDGYGAVTGILATDGQYTALMVDADNRLKEVRYPDGTSYHFSYDNRGQMIEEIDPNGNLFEHAFDSNGKLMSVSDPEGGGLQFSQFLSNNGVSTTRVDSAEGQKTIYQGSVGTLNEEILTTTFPNGSVSNSTTLADRSALSKSLACGTHENIQYGLDPVFQHRSIRNASLQMPSGLSASMSRERTYQYVDQTGLPDIVEDRITKNGKNWTIRKDVVGGLITNTSPLGRTGTLRYDPATLLTQEITVPDLLPTYYNYDNRGRLTRSIVGTRTLQMAYDQNGNLDYIVAPDSRTFDYAYDIMGRLLSETRPDGSEVEYQYDANGNLSALINPNSIAYDFGYTANNQRRSLSVPLSGSYQYLYDRDRRLKTVTLPSGRQITNTYTSGVLDYTTTPEGTIDYNYACNTRLSNAVRGGERVSYTYDGALVTSDTRVGSLGKTIGYTYNNDFALASMNYAGVTVNFGYDVDGLITSADGYTITRNAQNGLPVSVSGSGLTQSRTFSGYGEMDGSAWTAGAANPYQWNVSRDTAGRIVQRTEVIDGETITWEYAYDTLGRLIEVKKNSALVESYSYDANGNRLSEMNSLRGILNRACGYSIEDHILTAGADSYVFDVDGFLQSKTTVEGPTSFEYTSRSELLRADLADGKIITYLNDPLGRRIAKQVNGTTVEKYLWKDQTPLLAVYDGSDNLLQRYTYADARMPVSMTAGGATYFLLTDQVGTLRAVADTSGAIVKRIDYDSFGNIIADTNPGFSVPFGFAGGLHDRDTGLVRFGARDYDPAIGRFTAKDPIDFAGGDTNLYAYVTNDPINLTDPLGLYWFRQPWQTPGVVGRRGTPVPPRGRVSEFIEKYVPAGYTFGEMHDNFVDVATRGGISDGKINVPSMLSMYGMAISKELLRTNRILDQPTQPTPCK